MMKSLPAWAGASAGRPDIHWTRPPLPTSSGSAIRARSPLCTPAPLAASKGGELQATVFLFGSVLHAALRKLTSEPHLGQCPGRVDVCSQPHLPPLRRLGSSHLLGFCTAA